MADIHTPDLCVIGAGAGGLAVAEQARSFGASVVLVERDRIGGSLLRLGALPSRALAAAAAHAEAMRIAPGFGIAGEEPKPNFRKLHDQIEQTIAELAPASAEPRLKALGIEVLHGAASFTDARTVAVGDNIIKARRFVVATGAQPVVPDIAGLASVPYFTTRTIFDNTRKLTHLVIIGGGATGLELAQAYHRLGTQVTLVETGLALAGWDPELSGVALKKLREEGVAVLEHSTVTAIQPRALGIGVMVRAGETDTLLDVSHILVAAGSRPDVEGLGLERAGVRSSNAGALTLAAGFRTTNPRIYVIGDAAGGVQSVQSAAEQAARVVRHALFMLPARFDPLLVPRVVHTDPELAEVGLNELTARTRHGSRFRVTRFSFGDNHRARAAHAGYGTAKLVTDRWGKILGAGVAGQGAGELIAFFAFAMANGLSARHLSNFVPPYPALAEIPRRLGAEVFRAEVGSPWLTRWRALVRLLP